MKDTRKQEIIEAQEVHVGQKGTWETMTSKVTGTSKKTIAAFAVGALVLIGGAFVAAEIYESKIDAMEDRMEQQVRQQAAIANQKRGNQGIVTQETASSSIPASTQASTTAPAASAPATSSSAAPAATPVAPARTAYGVTLVDSSELDGTYTAQVGFDSYTLTIKGNQATLLEIESDGDQNLEEIIFDLDRKIAYVDGDVENYTFDGTRLTLTEVDRNIFDQDQITFTRQ